MLINPWKKHRPNRTVEINNSTAFHYPAIITIKHKNIPLIARGGDTIYYLSRWLARANEQTNDTIYILSVTLIRMNIPLMKKHRFIYTCTRRSRSLTSTLALLECCVRRFRFLMWMSAWLFSVRSRDISLLSFHRSLWNLRPERVRIS